jgi:hypothetical protein
MTPTLAASSFQRRASRSGMKIGERGEGEKEREQNASGPALIFFMHGQKGPPSALKLKNYFEGRIWGCIQFYRKRSQYDKPGVYYYFFLR